jgi:predicted O-methyltransferase YrrM
MFGLGERSALEACYLHLLKRPASDAEISRAFAALGNSFQFQEAFIYATALAEYKELNRVKVAWPPGHFHSAIADPQEAASYFENSYDKVPESVPGVRLSIAEMEAFWRRQDRTIASTPFSDKEGAEFRYYYHPIFPHGDGIMLRTMIETLRPQRIIEIGSGHSTACMLDSAELSGLDDISITCIEPDPPRLLSKLRKQDIGRITILKEKVQNVSIDVFKALQPGDILFVDSSHVMKAASDVHFIFFHILPALQVGVTVHFHDIFYPFDYHRSWNLEKNFSWTEAYALRAFLQFNSSFRVVFFNDLFAKQRRELIKETKPTFLANPGGSIWIERIS